MGARADWQNFLTLHKKWIETLIWSRGNVYIYPYMCFFKFIMFTKVICDNPDLINCIVPLVWYLKVTWKLCCIMVWDISKKLSSHESTHAHSHSSMNYVKLQWNEIKHIQNYVHHVIWWFRITNTMKKRLVKSIYIVVRYDVADVFIICIILFLLKNYGIVYKNHKVFFAYWIQFYRLTFNKRSQ